MNRSLPSAAAILVSAAIVAACHLKTSAEHIESGDAFIKAGKHFEAIVEYRAALESEPRDGATRYKLGHAYEVAQDYAHAAQEYIAASELSPNNADVQVKGASMFLLGRHFEEARICAERALRADPGNVVAHVLLAQAQSGLKRTGAALASIQKAITLDPTRAQTYADLGIFQFANGAPEQAEANLKRASEASPRQAQPHLTLASVYWAQGRMGEAEEELKKGVEAEPDNITAARALATFYLGNGRAPEAERYLKSIADKTAEPGPSLALADYYIALDRTGDATALLERIASTKEGYGDARSRLAAIAYGAGKKTEAMALIDATLTKAPRSSRALQTKANFLMAEGKLDDALTLLKASVEADPRSAPARYALAALYSARQLPDAAAAEYNEILRFDPDSIAAKMSLARLHLATGNKDLASDLAQQAATSRPNPDTALLLARTLAAKGELSRAETVLRPLINAGIDRADILSLTGVVLAGRGDSDEARQIFERAMALHPDAYEPIEGLVGMDLREGNVTRARSRVEQRLARRPRDSRLLVLAARTYLAARDLNLMATTLRAAIEADPTNTIAYGLLGQAYAVQGKLPDALREFEQLSARDPRSVPVHTMAAYILEALKRPDEAEKRYQHVLELDPRAPVAANNLAWMYADRGQNLDVALQLAQVAKEGLPEHPDVNDTLAWIYFRKDLPNLALAPLKISIERDPANAVFQYHLGLVYMKTGDIDLARQALEAALKLDSKFENAKEAREALDLLR